MWRRFRSRNKSGVRVYGSLQKGRIQHSDLDLRVLVDEYALDLGIHATRAGRAADPGRLHSVPKPAIIAGMVQPLDDDCVYIAVADYGIAATNE
ncbi:hypothetical protein [Methanoculleus sp.]|uniref:hypothetical protein n=1 Tax=Methanoculleus sp. TaxID=90427 RepID=UPI0025EF7DB0|nr:hypothetical protein [Methanoculleus sp.]